MPAQQIHEIIQLSNENIRLSKEIILTFTLWIAPHDGVRGLELP